MGDAGDRIDESTITQTPLVELELEVSVDLSVFAKVEWFNLYATAYGGGSVKSRIAKAMLDAAEASGDLVDQTIIEPTSGNTGSELAKLGRNRGYTVEIVMPDNASSGKIDAIRDTGATIHFVPADAGYDAVLARCDELVSRDPGKYYLPNQYTNPHNPGVHESTTAPELWAQTSGRITCFIAGVGTGGTITGTGRGLHERGDVQVVGFEPANPLHAIDGLKYLKTGDHYHPETYDESVLDEKRYVETDDAYRQARSLRSRYVDRSITVVDSGQHDSQIVRNHLRVNGEFIVGTSSGGAIQVLADLIADGVLTEDDVAVVMFADRGDKYADIPLWGDLF